MRSKEVEEEEKKNLAQDIVTKNVNFVVNIAKKYINILLWFTRKCNSLMSEVGTIFGHLNIYIYWFYVAKMTVYSKMCIFKPCHFSAPII